MHDLTDLETLRIDLAANVALRRVEQRHPAAAIAPAALYAATLAAAGQAKTYGEDGNRFDYWTAGDAVGAAPVKP